MPPVVTRRDIVLSNPTVGYLKVVKWTPESAPPESAPSPSPAKELSITLDLTRVARIFAYVIAFLALAHTGVLVARFVFGHSHLLGLSPLFNLKQESSVPTAVSGSLLFLAFLLLVLVAVTNRKRRDPYRFQWLALAAAFAFLTLDEVGHIHERYDTMVRTLSGMGRPGHSFFLTYSIAAAALGLFCVPMLRAFRRNQALLFCLAGALYVGGAAGTEAIAVALIKPLGGFSLPVQLLAAIGEVLELSGVSTMIVALLVYIRDEFGPTRLRVT
jgi:hypothetical protein